MTRERIELNLRDKKTPAVTSRGIGGQPEDIGDTVRYTQVIDVSAARSSYAKDYEHSTSGRSPDSWLQTLFIWPSHPTQKWDSGWYLFNERMNSSPVTVARLRRIYTDFPILPEHPAQATR